MSEESNASSGSKEMALAEKTKIYLKISPIRKKNKQSSRRSESNRDKLREAGGALFSVLYCSSLKLASALIYSCLLYSSEDFVALFPANSTSLEKSEYGLETSG